MNKSSIKQVCRPPARTAEMYAGQGAAAVKQKDR